MASLRPSVIVVRAYVWRGAKLWLVVRAAVSAVLLFGQGDPMRFTASQTLVLLGAIIAIAFVDMRRHRETIFIGNLGLHPVMVALLFGAPALAGEVLIRSGASLLPS